MKLTASIANAYNRKIYEHLNKQAHLIRRAMTRAGMAGAEEMKNIILDSPTGTPSHRRRNMDRIRERAPLKNGVQNRIGSRIETGNMFNSVHFKRGKIVQNIDRRRRGEIDGGFGWPAYADGRIKDAPSSPLAKSRQPDTKNWRTDPRYFEMQEYGGPKTPAMNSQSRALQVAKNKLLNELAKLGIR